MTIPIIDLELSDRSVAERAKVARAVGDACEKIGFFVVTGHGVPEEIDRGCWNNARAFFDMPLVERQAVRFPHVGYPYGYAPMKWETLSISRDEVSPPDLKESFSIGPLKAPETRSSDPSEALVYSANLWPHNPPEFRQSLEAYYRAMEGLAARLMMLFAQALDLPPSFFDEKIDRHISALRVINYPDQDNPPEPGQLRAGAHSDYGSLTILRQEQAPGGLEVVTRDGDWTPVPAIDGAYVVNIGDLMARWTNDRWVSTLHRVVNPPPDAFGSSRRQSIAFFHQPNWDAEIACLPSCQDPVEGAKYEPVASGAYLMSKFQSTVEPNAAQ
ncbi:MAG: 2-oxoglutarate and iron-dependent oxygenase domain-containing protein [Pseudomonadota bacterium]